MSLRSTAIPLTRLNSLYSVMYLPSLVRICTRWLWRSADRPQVPPVGIESGNPPDQIRILDVGVALSHVDVARRRVGNRVRRIGQRVRRVTHHARSADRHQHVAVGAELHDDAP